MAQQRGFQLVRTDRYLSPNQARNLGLRYAKSEYVVFVDNDVLVTPGWLEELVRCAEETGAWVVGPLYLESTPELRIIHMAGGTIQIEEQQGGRVLYERHRFAHQAMSSLQVSLQREPCELIEFHTALVRTEVFEQIGPLAEALLSAPEHVDLCMAVQKVGGSVYFEPNAVVTYIPPPPLALSDLPFYMLRWSDAWNSASLRHFNEKWDVSCMPAHDPWLTEHRRLFLARLRRYTSHIFRQRTDKFEKKCLHPAERALNRWFIRLFFNNRRDQFQS